MVVVVKMEEEIVARLKIDERIWREVKAGAASRGEPVQEFATNLLWAGLRLVDKKEAALEYALLEAEEKLLSVGFRILRGGAILFERNRELHMELMKENVHIHISYLGIWIVRDPDFAIGGSLWSPEDLNKIEFENENEKKIALEALQIAEETFSAILRDYAELNLQRKENGRML